MSQINGQYSVVELVFAAQSGSATGTVSARRRRKDVISGNPAAYGSHNQTMHPASKQRI
jgi:hypothetical protein